MPTHDLLHDLARWYAHAWATQGRPFTREDEVRLGAMVRQGDLMAMQAVGLMFGSVGCAWDFRHCR